MSPERANTLLLLVRLFLSFSLRDFQPEFDPLNMLKNSPNLAGTSGPAKNLIICKNYPPPPQNDSLAPPRWFLTCCGPQECRIETKPTTTGSSPQDLKIVYSHPSSKSNRKSARIQKCHFSMHYVNAKGYETAHDFGFRL